MLHIDVIAVGRLKERFWTEACQEYLKRITPYAQIKVIEVSDIDPASVGGSEKALAREAEEIVRTLPNGAHIILLDIQGKELSSPRIATALEHYSLDGISRLAFVIGGSHGVDAQIRSRAHERWSFGPITLPHNLARVVLLEQLYRAFKINRKEPYHK